MELENQVSSLELSQKLKELGVPQESAFQWIPYPEGSSKHGEWYLQLVPVRGGKGLYNMTGVSAYTASELGEMLPFVIEAVGEKYYLTIDKAREHWHVNYEDIDDIRLFKDDIGRFCANTEADARSLMLAHLIEQGLLDVKTLHHDTTN